MKRAVATLLYIYLYFAGVCGQEINVSAAFDTSRIFLGDHINFTVTIDKPLSYLLSVPVFKDTLLKNIEILNGPVIDSSYLKDGRIRIKGRISGNFI